MISYKLFFKFISSRSKIYLNHQLNYCQDISLNKAGHNTARSALKDIDYNNFYKHENKSFINDLEDIQMSQIDWDEVYNSIHKNFGTVFVDKKLPHILLEGFVKCKKVNLLDSFLNYMLNCDVYHNTHVILKTLEVLIYNNHGVYVDKFLDIYKRVVRSDEYEVLFDNYVRLLLASELREEGLRLLSDRPRDDQMLRHLIIYSPDSESWTNIVNYVEEYLSLENVVVPIDVIQKMFDKIQDDDKMTLRSVLNLLSKNRKHIWMTNINYLQSITKKIGLQLKLDSIQILTCDGCGQNIPKVDINCKSCHDIADIMMVDVMKIHSGEALYQSSSPAEISRFETFIKTCHFPFDCVIDFPNIMHQRMQLFPKDSIYVNLLTTATNHLITLNQMNPNIKNICLVGKYIFQLNVPPSKFIYDLKQRLWSFKLQSNVTLSVSHYFSEKSTKDDILALYVALKSGPDCYIVTNDEFRDHRAQIKDARLHRVFKDWQSCRQILMKNSQHSKVTTRTTMGMFKMPDQYLKCVSFDKRKSTFHIPYANDHDSASVKTSFSTHVKWACLRF